MKNNTQKNCSNKNSLKRNERLRRKNDIDALFAEKKSVRSTPSFALLFRENKEGERHQIMFIVPKRNMRKAHKRARMKRIMRAIYRTRKQDFLPKDDARFWFLGLLFRGGDNVEHFENLEKQIEKTFKAFKSEISKIDT